MLCNILKNNPGHSDSQENIMPDFTLSAYRLLLQSLLDAGYAFQPFCDFLEKPPEHAVILRHDVDALPGHSLKTAQLEHALGIRGTYYFRIVSKSNSPEIIRSIAELDHEIGYHYEDLALAGKAFMGQGTRDKGQGRGGDREKGSEIEERLYELAIKNFEKNLHYFRQFGPVKTICMHGSPLSRYDNRKIWEKYDYRNYGITGEPYFDIDFSKVLYLTDTGRRWDGEKVSVRDKALIGTRKIGRRGEGEKGGGMAIHSTFDIITAIRNKTLPNQIMLTIHPQRWTNHPLLWTRELVWQNVKNVVKRMINADSEGRF